jgi:hypothetical protein
MPAFHLSADQIAAIVLSVRFTGPEVAVAVALAESGGRTDALHVNPGPPPSRVAASGRSTTGSTRR